MWKKGCDHDVVLLIFGTRFLAQTATEKCPNKHSVQNKHSLIKDSKSILIAHFKNALQKKFVWHIGLEIYFVWC